MTKARIVTGFDTGSRVVHCHRGDITKNVFALSHRWQERQGSQNWTVNCDGETYPCNLFPEEASNLQSYVDKYGSLWLDYICIKQGDDKDKVAQVSIMGGIYSNATSLIVGPGLAPCMPNMDYIERAWCIQERMFGRVKFPWNFDNEDPDKLIAFARDLLVRLPGIDAVSDKLWDDYDHRENWRVGALQSAKQKFPQAAAEIERAIHLMTDNDKVELAKLVFKIRELISCDEPVDDIMWNEKMFDCVSAFALDRLYGVWGVPMYHKGVELPYDNPQRAWQLVCQHYPASNYAYYSRLIAYTPTTSVDDPFFGFTEHASVTSVVHNLLQCGEPSATDPTHEERWQYNHYPERCPDSEVLSVTIRRGHGFFSIVWDEDERAGVVISVSAFRAHGKLERPFLRFVDRCNAIRSQRIYWRCPFELHNHIRDKINSGNWS
eukprot:c8456_g1_i1.p2 GENE.c8456_g1_i1~~c8456_g1_i1.p2  ORF type:complete len:456 (+),score=152.38 c8456_g1_i1:65-1369(+)